AQGRRLGHHDGLGISARDTSSTDRSRAGPSAATGGSRSRDQESGRIRADLLCRSIPCGGARHMNREMQIVRAVELAADEFYGESGRFGNMAAECFGTGDAGRSQITGLESIANSAIKVSDVLDYV